MARKTAKGRARGHVRQRGRTWSVVLTVRDPATGLPKQKWYSGFKDAAAAEQKKTALLKEIDDNTWVEPSTLTVATYVRKWLDLKHEDLAPKTRERYRDFIEGYIIPALGGLRLQKLRPIHLKDFYTAARAGTAPTADGKPRRHAGGLARRTVRHLHAVVREALRDAVEDGLLAKSPAPLLKRTKGEARPEAKVLDEAQAAALVAAAKGHPLEPLIVLAFTTGCRRGELLGLDWSAVDLERGTLTVRRSLEVTKGEPHPGQPRERYVFKEPKTERSKRVVSLPALAVETLSAHRRAQKRAKFQAGPAWTKDPLYQDLVFTREDGRPLNPTWTSKAVTRLAQKAGLSVGVTLHTTRHAHASILLGAGVPLPAVSARLGHANVAITAAVYSHALPKQDAEAAVRLDGALRAAGIVVREG